MFFEISQKVHVTDFQRGFCSGFSIKLAKLECNLQKRNLHSSLANLIENPETENCLRIGSQLFEIFQK